MYFCDPILIFKTMKKLMFSLFAAMMLILFLLALISLQLNAQDLTHDNQVVK